MLTIARPSSCLLCAVVCLLFGDAAAFDSSEIKPEDNAHRIGGTNNNHGNDNGTQAYPFDRVYHSYKIQPNELIKDTKLYPPISYNTPEGYLLALEPIVQFCKVSNASIFTKFSVVRSKDKVYINVNEDLFDTLTSDSTIVYKLKAINEDNSIGGETTVLIRVVQYLPVPDTKLEFEEPSYSIKLSYGRKGKVFQFKPLKKAVKVIDNDVDLEFEKQPDSDKHVLQTEYPFGGNYSLEYVPDHLLPVLRVSKYGELEVIGNIDEGFYNFDIVAVDYGPNSSTRLKAKSKVHVFIDNVAVCDSKEPSFIKAFSKHYITEETKLHTVIPAMESSHNCSFAISHQYPFGVGDEFFDIDPKTGAVHTVKPVDREAYAFEDMEEPSVYLRLKVHCPPPDRPTPVLPLHIPDVQNIEYDPSTTLVQLVIEDVNDNWPAFADRRLTVGCPVPAVAAVVPPRHLMQVKATDKDAGKHGKIQYSLRGRDSEDFLVNSETGTIYCTRPADNGNAEKTFDVVATDNDGKPNGLESTMSITVKFLTFANIIRVMVNFSTNEDHLAIESQLSEISGIRIVSFADNVVNKFVGGTWQTVRTLTVYGVNSDGSLESASDLEMKLSGNGKILEISEYSIKNDDDTGTSLVHIALFCLMLSLIAMCLLYFGYIKNGRYLSCISSTSNTPLKDDMENILNQFSTNVCRSQSNWITTLNRSNTSSSRARFPGKANSPVPKSKMLNNNCVVVETSTYEPIPPKGLINVSADCNSSILQLDSKLSFEDDMLKLEKMEGFNSPTEERCLSY